MASSNYYSYYHYYCYSLFSLFLVCYDYEEDADRPEDRPPWQQLVFFAEYRRSLIYKAGLRVFGRCWQNSVERAVHAISPKAVWGAGLGV